MSISFAVTSMFPPFSVSELEFNEILSTLSPYDLVAYGELEPFYEKICEWLKVDRKNILLSRNDGELC